MAEMIAAGRSGKRKKALPKVDLTPMVDLGFLLISFFMMTTTLVKQNALTLNMPSDERTDHPTTIPEESALTVIPVGGHKFAYIMGNPEHGSDIQYCTERELRRVLLDRKRIVAALPATFSAAAHKLYVLLKPGAGCTYGDVVYVLDEMNIDDIGNYALMNISALEQERVDAGKTASK